MTLKVYNTLTRKKEKFIPVEKKLFEFPIF